MQHTSHTEIGAYIVMGKADDIRHAASDPNRVYPVVSMDYIYFTQSENCNFTLVVHDDDAGSMMAFAVPAKGGPMANSQKVCRWMPGFGYGKIIMKSDQEPSINGLLRVAGEDGMKVVEELTKNVRSLTGMEAAGYAQGRIGLYISIGVSVCVSLYRVSI